MNAKILIVLGLAAVAAADSDEFRGYSVPQGSFESYEPSDGKYDFNWAVNHPESGNDFGHQATHDGDNTQGSYYVQLPDGRRQTVTYYVDGDNGYIADVKYDGEARYPDSYESSFETVEAPRYTPPQRRYFDSNESK